MARPLTDHRRSRGTLLVAAAIAAALCACGQAEVYRRDGATIEGKILPSPHEAVYVKPRGSGSVVEIPRGQVVGVDHPGDGLGVTGLLITSLYAPIIVGGWLELRQPRPDYPMAPATHRSAPLARARARPRRLGARCAPQPPLPHPVSAHPHPRALLSPSCLAAPQK